MAKPKNVIVFMTDQQHFRTLGCNGCTEAITPNIDAFASRNLNFRNHFVTNQVCSPSRASLMTGLYPGEHGLWGNGCALPQHLPTIPKVLGDAGYQTAHIGKLHLTPIVSRVGRHPNYGFQHALIAEDDQQHTDDDYYQWLKSTSPDLFTRLLQELFDKGQAAGYTSCMPEEKYLGTWLMNRTREWMEQQRDPSKPFFLHFSIHDPHHPFAAIEPYASRFKDRPMTPPVFQEGAVDSKPKHYRDTVAWMVKSMTRGGSPEMLAIQRAYHAMVHHVDHLFGQMLELLERNGLSDDTAIIFTTDHGEMLGNHGLLWKGPYNLDDLMHVPMLAGTARGLGKGRNVDELTSGVDLLSTVCAITGVEAPATSGRRFLDAKFSPCPDGGREAVYWEWEGRGQTPTSSIRAMRTRTHTFAHYAHSTEGELYDNAADPNQFRNLWADPASSGLRSQMFDRLARHYLSRRPHVRDVGGW
jgi:arylsulfatase